MKGKNFAFEILIGRVKNVPSLFIKIIHSENEVQGRASFFSLLTGFFPHTSGNNIGKHGN